MKPPFPQYNVDPNAPNLSASDCEINAHPGPHRPWDLFRQHCIGGRGVEQSGNVFCQMGDFNADTGLEENLFLGNVA